MNRFKYVRTLSVGGSFWNSFLANLPHHSVLLFVSFTQGAGDQEQFQKTNGVGVASTILLQVEFLLQKYSFMAPKIRVCNGTFRFYRTSIFAVAPSGFTEPKLNYDTITKKGKTLESSHACTVHAVAAQAMHTVHGLLSLISVTS